MPFSVSFPQLLEYKHTLVRKKGLSLTLIQKQRLLCNWGEGIVVINTKNLSKSSSYNRLRINIHLPGFYLSVSVSATQSPIPQPVTTSFRSMQSCLCPLFVHHRHPRNVLLEAVADSYLTIHPTPDLHKFLAGLLVFSLKICVEIPHRPKMLLFTILVFIRLDPGFMLAQSKFLMISKPILYMIYVIRLPTFVYTSCVTCWG